MNLERADAFVAAVLAGSLMMERIVAIAKTVFPGWLGEPGPNPEGPGWRARQAVRTAAGPRTDWRRLRVLGLVLLASLITTLLVRTPDTFEVQYATGATIHGAMFTLLISGGSAFWAQVVGLLGAAKDFRARSSTEVERVVVVNAGDEVRAQGGGGPTPG